MVDGLIRVWGIGGMIVPGESLTQCHFVHHTSHMNLVNGTYCLYQQSNTAVPWLRRLVAGLPPRRPGFDAGSVHVGFVVDKVALGQLFLPVLRFSTASFIPPVLHYKEKRKNESSSQGCTISLKTVTVQFGSVASSVLVS
jgi:hypothetical protein